ncbi:MAG TPA: 4-hydroxy-tetrahydrodipicolinate reductase [Candidatus Wallbacteria bacterium]|mgnify:CR=1 FL=1|nr:4-hydroxy-tetrahydrodipicolinate reductase [Candidatus Wallbacteria bacterium]
MHKINVAIAGALGRMGTAVAEAIREEKEMELVGLIDVNEIGSKKYGISVTNEIEQAKFLRPADVLVDFTHPQSVFENVKKAVSLKIHCVVGTTGLSSENFEEIEKLTKENGVAVLVAPNFAIGAVLMMKFSQIAAKYMKKAEIIEFHHDKKADAPSGTALMTAKMMAENLRPQSRLPEIFKLEGVRGGEISGINIHSVRLPGMVAHQQVIFGDIGQTLTIRHDSLSLDSFMPGIVTAIKAIVKRKGFYFGLENFLDLKF